jgi:hypothetical protein
MIDEMYMYSHPDWDDVKNLSDKVNEIIRALNTAESANTSDNTASTPLKCVRCGVNQVSDFCASCMQRMLKESNAL